MGNLMRDMLMKLIAREKEKQNKTKITKPENY